MAARRAAQQRKIFKPNSLNKHMQISPITTQSITTSQTVENMRVQTTRREYQDNGGRMEVRETHYYYYIYDNKGKINESPAANSVDLRV